MEFRNATIRPEWYVKQLEDILIWGYSERFCAVKSMKVREGLENLEAWCEEARGKEA